MRSAQSLLHSLNAAQQVEACPSMCLSLFKHLLGSLASFCFVQAARLVWIFFITILFWESSLKLSFTSPKGALAFTAYFGREGLSESAQFHGLPDVIFKLFAFLLKLPWRMICFNLGGDYYAALNKYLLSPWTDDPLKTQLCTSQVQYLLPSHHHPSPPSTQPSSKDQHSVRWCDISGVEQDPMRSSSAVENFLCYLVTVTWDLREEQGTVGKSLDGRKVGKRLTAKETVQSLEGKTELGEKVAGRKLGENSGHFSALLPKNYKEKSPWCWPRRGGGHDFTYTYYYTYT